ncbi:collagen alpha-5(VI) chain-like isoform X1 [Ruditapes philippinarum]|uniref:collagen alpha-5(VI) chain-like isoform X1 n=1 Tax=Ruditapes philippinarum TaxID=129788 RepID=UPI00295C0097|nr:collagen alpha-5(VI) chain-like isoform X1 [Ruditapes philippinarum]
MCPAKPFDRIDGSPYQFNQAAMVTYSTHVTTNFYFNTFNTTVSIQNAIKSAAYVGRLTYTNKAFDQAKVLFQPGKGVRDAALAKNEVLILSDGQSSSRTLAQTAVGKLKLVADIYGLMIGNFTQAGMDELTKCVSFPKNEHLFSIKYFSQFKDLVNALEAKKIQAGDKWCAPFTP